MSFLQNRWYCAALSTEVTQIPMRRKICNENIALFRTSSGNVAGLEDRCSHRQAALSMGTVIDETIECRYHGFTFNTSGECLHIPHQQFTPPTARIRAYTMREKWGYAWLWYGTKDADLSALPDLPWTANPQWRAVYFYFHVNAAAQLMADNLLDISHTDFLHRQSIGSRTGKYGQTNTPMVELSSRIEGERVYYQRIVRDTELAEIAAAWAATKKRVTRTSTQSWEPPNTVHIELALDNEETHRKIKMEHIMTPETERTTHYFMNWTRDFSVDNLSYPTDDDVWREQTGVIGSEDIPMVEGQQRNIDCFAGVRDVGAVQDQFISLVHKALRDIYQAEGQAVPPELLRNRPVAMR